MIYLSRLNVYYIFPHNYVRLNPEVQVLCSPISLCIGDDVVYMGPLTRSIKFSTCKFIALRFCYEVTA